MLHLRTYSGDLTRLCRFVNLMAMIPVTPKTTIVLSTLKMTVT